MRRCRFVRAIATLCAGALLYLAVGCGTLLYPERKGRRGGRADVGVIIMDGLWCLAFIIPGVVAFVVDFSTGAIYVSNEPEGWGNVRVIHLPDGRTDAAAIEQAIAEVTGVRVRLDSPEVVRRPVPKGMDARSALSLARADLRTAF
jgi:hypothetical protein